MKNISTTNAIFTWIIKLIKEKTNITIILKNLRQQGIAYGYTKIINKLNISLAVDGCKILEIVCLEDIGPRSETCSAFQINLSNFLLLVV